MVRFLRKRRPLRRRIAKKRAPLRAKRPAIKKMIRREIARANENKTSQHFVTNRDLVTIVDGSFVTSNIFPLGPDPSSMVISQGTGQGQRVGNRITTKSFVYKGTLVAKPYDSIFNTTPRPMHVKMWIFYDRTIPTAVPNPVAAADFFQNGSSVRPLQNNLTDMWAPVNTDRYRILAARTFKLGNAEYNTGGGGTATNQFFTNNDFKYNCNFSINLTKLYPKMVKFNDGTATPSTRGLFCMIEYVSATGGAFFSGTTAVSLQSMQSYVYEDA